MLTKLRSRLTFANVVAFIAMFIALSGGAYALTIPKNSVGAKQLKRNAVIRSKIDDGAITSSKVKSGSLLAKDFKPGELAAGVFSSRLRNEAGLTQELFAPVAGVGPESNTDETAVVQISPAGTIVARNLFATYANHSALDGATRSFTLRVDGSDSSLTCTYTAPATSCSNTIDAVTIPAGSVLSIRFFQGGSSIGDGDVLVGFQATSP